MQIISNPKEIYKEIQIEKNKGKKIAFVPTMGALHLGHCSLLEKAKKIADIVVLSIFVNPLQFSNAEDLEKYPITLDADLELAKSFGVDYVFTPTKESLYTSNIKEFRATKVLASSLAEGYCGASRPGHFDGVVTVVSILFNCINPDYAIFGEKDFQQVKVIQQMVNDLFYPVQIVVSPLIRDKDGLALSSRNLRLTNEQKEIALQIPKAVFTIQNAAIEGEKSCKVLYKLFDQIINDKAGLEIDYRTIVSEIDLEEEKEITRNSRLLTAVYVGSIRLLDTIPLYK